MTKPTALGVYVFAGGFTLGVREHFEVVAHLEESMYGVKSSLRANPGLEVHVKEEFWPLDKYVGRVDYIFANPPCAPFSQAGATMRGGGDAWKTDPRLRCWHNCFVAFEAVRPRVFTIESVTRAYTAADSLIRSLEELVHAQGYSVTHLLVDTQNYGMAQRRKRYFFVAHDVDIDFPLTADDYPNPCVNDLIAGVTDPGYYPSFKHDHHEALIPFLRPGMSFRKMWERFHSVEDRGETATGGVEGRPRIFIHRVDGEGVIGTITGDYFVHPTLDRFMGINELKVLNGFPRDYWFEGNPKSHFSLLSRGVCPPVAEWLAKNIREGVERGDPPKDKTRAIDLRKL